MVSDKGLREVESIQAMGAKKATARKVSRITRSRLPQDKRKNGFMLKRPRSARA